MVGCTNKYYGLEDFNSWKRSQGLNFRVPPRPNFISAAGHVASFFNSHEFTWAALGGLAMLYLGSPRNMFDIHIIYHQREFQRMKDKLELDRRYFMSFLYVGPTLISVSVKLPRGMSPLSPTKVLLRTGPVFQDEGCTDNVDIECNFIPTGRHASLVR